MEKLRDETGVPISTQIELRLKGYSIDKEVRIPLSLSKTLFDFMDGRRDDIEKEVEDFGMLKEVFQWLREERNALNAGMS